MLYISAAGRKRSEAGVGLSVCEGEASRKTTTTRAANTTDPAGLSVSSPADSEMTAEKKSSAPGREERTEEGLPTSHCLRQMSMFLRCAFEKWSHAFCLVAALKTVVICSTLG